MLKHRVAAAWREFEAAGFAKGIEAAVDGFLLSFFFLISLFSSSSNNSTEASLCSLT